MNKANNQISTYLEKVDVFFILSLVSLLFLKRALSIASPPYWLIK